MGVLEDAIRQHLELKRQHGASEEEVVRQETEVLGNARQAAPPEGEEESLTEDEAAAEAEEAATVDDRLAVEEPFAEEAPLAEEEPFAEEPPAAEEALASEQPFAEQPPAAEEALASEQPFAEQPPAAEEPPEGLYLDEEPVDQDTAESRPFDERLEDEPSRDDTVTLEDPVEFDELEPGVAPPMPAQEGAPDEGEPGEEDVLEETPEFLQETPEHDRLWFEQKPPRDFDFD